MKAYIGLGSNLGDRLRNIHEAIQKISQLNEVEIERVSNIYETEPEDCEGGLFYNAVLEIGIGIDPESLLQELLNIEKSLGRTRLKRGEERPIDLDILLWGDTIIDSPQLIIPHPRLHLRKFVLEPLCELDKTLVHPILRKTVKELLEILLREGSMRLPQARRNVGTSKMTG